MTVLAANLHLSLVLLDHLGLGHLEETGVGGVGHERTGLTEGVKRVDRVIEPGSTCRRHRIAGRGSVERILCAAARFLLLGRELVEPIGRGLTERLERLGGPVRGGVGASEPCADRTRVVTRAGKIERRAERFDGVSRTSELHEAVTKLGQGRRGRRVRAVDRRLAKRRARLGNAVQSKERPAQAELRLVRGGIGAVLERLGEAPDYRFSLANERTFLAWIRTALGFLAAGVGLDQLAPDFATPLIREVLALLLCLIAGVLAIYGYLRWLRNEKAMRLKQDLPYTRGLIIISTILLMVAGVVMLLVLYAG